MLLGERERGIETARLLLSAGAHFRLPISSGTTELKASYFCSSQSIYLSPWYEPLNFSFSSLSLMCLWSSQKVAHFERAELNRAREPEFIIVCV